MSAENTLACRRTAIKSGATGMQQSKLFVPAADLRIARKLSHGAAMLLPRPMIIMVFVTHMRPSFYKRQLRGLSGTQRL